MEDKNVKGYLETLAQEMNGNYTEYSDDTVILTVPLEEGRFQSIRGIITEKDSGLMLILTSTICRLHEYPNVVDFRRMLEMNYELGYAKITITDEDYLELMAAIKYELATPGEIRYMINEVAATADRLEFEITGDDQH
ncbi:MAG: YbjN domain-containing protein [Microscillaceae bacterium]|nr:YbjN domain-containing protein [Microscillaceae bacterium]